MERGRAFQTTGAHCTNALWPSFLDGLHGMYHILYGRIQHTLNATKIFLKVKKKEASMMLLNKTMIS